MSGHLIVSRGEVLSLYRQFLRIGSRMAVTSSNHGLHVLRRAKREFKEGSLLQDATEAAEAVQLARVLLDSLKAQEVHKEMGTHRQQRRGGGGGAVGDKGADDFW
jgi:hypothetical protein